MKTQNSPPQFAVVGHPNKGKSSFVAALAQDDSVFIASQSGTTIVNQSFPFKLDGKTMYTLVDTPGFQRARETFEWLQAHCTDALERTRTIQNFLTAHQEDERFIAETQLLTPIMKGAGIIYVVDGSRPYGAEYEVEMEILRWTGQASMALINLIGQGDHVEEWRSVLNQHFKIVRLFNPLKASFEDRISLLRGFAQLDDRWHAGLESSVAALIQQRKDIEHQSATIIATLIQTAIIHVESDNVDIRNELEIPKLKLALEQSHQHSITELEKIAHKKISLLYQLHRFEARLPKAAIIQPDLFSTESTELFGLKSDQLLTTSVAGGALAGGIIDLAVGGHSFFLGAGLGAAAAGVTGWLASSQLAKVEFLGQSLGKRKVVIGPVKNRNFPYILLSRALLYQSTASSYSHADRQTEKVELSDALLKNQELKIRIPFEKLFSTLRKGNSLTPDQSNKLTKLILERIRSKTNKTPYT